MIFKCFWYNKDHYGPTDGIYVFVGADSETDATQKAIDFINKKYPCAGKGYDFDKYEHYDCVDLTNETILWMGHFSGGFPS
jgi:hypothetical protein